MRVGWIGLGAMGAPMAACLARSGHSVTGYDIVPGRATALAPDGVRSAETIAAAIDGADVVAIMVATPDQLEQALFAPDGVIGPTRPAGVTGLAGPAGSRSAGTVVMIMATVGPASVVSAAGRLAAAGVVVVDAPVSGGVQRAAAGDLLIMVSGPAGPVTQIQPLLGALARSAPVGPVSGGEHRRGVLARARAVTGYLLQGKAEGGGQGGDGEEGGGGDAAGLDLAQGLGGDTGGRGDLGHAARPARLAQQHAEPFAARVLVGAQWRPDHTVILIPV
jgi:hypothetical protein